MTLSTILLSAQTDPVLIKLVLLAVGIIAVGLVLRLLKQPYIVAYIIAGLVMGPYGLEVITDEALISSLGSFGLILLLFFIGMEISLPQLIGNWKISIVGTLIQVIFSISAVLLIGYFLEWPYYRIIMLGFVISLSSTAVVIKLLQDRNEIKSKVGQNVIGILLAQDVIIVPMLIIISYMSGEKPENTELIKQIIGGILMIGFVIWLFKKKELKLPLHSLIKNDHEIQVFVAFAICFGFAIITAFFGLSSALGAFVAGIVVSTARSTEWVHDSLHAFRVVFVALFFVSIGMLIDLHFLKEHFAIILLFVGLVFIINNLINTSVLRMFGEGWKESLYAGAILAQVGEFSYILGETGYSSGLITEFTYQLIISIISISLIISPIWVELMRRILKVKLPSKSSI